MTEVDPDDPAFADPTKFVGPVYTEERGRRLAARRGWVVRPDGDAWRRVVPSPLPRRIVEIRPVEWLLAQGCVVICAGGGGIPTMYRPGTRTLVGVEAVIDKDRASAVLAHDLGADLLVIATDVDAVLPRLGHRRTQRAVVRAHPDALDPALFPAGSMGPEGRGGRAVRPRVRLVRPSSASLEQLTSILAGDGGTRISVQAEGMETR